MQIIDRIVQPVVHTVQVRPERRKLCYQINSCFVRARPAVVKLPERIDALSQSVYVRSNCSDELVYPLFTRRGDRHCATWCRNVCRLCQLVMTRIKVRLRWIRAGDIRRRLQIPAVGRLDLVWRLFDDNHGIGFGADNARNGVDYCGPIT